MKGLSKLAKGDDEVFINKGYYTLKLDAQNKFEDYNRVINAYSDEELFTYVGHWQAQGKGMLEPTQDNVVFEYMKPLDTENKRQYELELKHIMRNDLKVFFKNRVNDTGGTETALPKSISKVQFINTYFIFIDTNRANYLVLKPAINDINPGNNVYYMFGSRMHGAKDAPYDMGFHSLATRSNFQGVKFVGIFVGPDIYQLGLAGIPARTIIETDPVVTAKVESALELYLPLQGLKMDPIPYPDPRPVNININNIDQFNYFLEGVCLYKVGITTFEGYKLIKQSERVLIFDNGFKMYDLNSGFVDRNIIEFGSEVAFIENDVYRVAEARKREIMTSLIGTAISTGLGMIPGISTGRALIKAGVATQNFANDSATKTSAGLLKMNAEKRNMGNLQLSLLQEEFKKKKNPSDVDKEILRLESNIQRSRNALIGERQLFDTENIKHSRERGIQIGESQKIAGQSQIMYSALSPVSGITGGASQIVSFINEKTNSPANISQGANVISYSALTFWSEGWYSFANSAFVENLPVQRLFSQTHQRYYPSKDYIKKINLDLLDNGVNLALFYKLKDLLKDNPNCVLNINPDSVMKVFYKYFEYLPNEFETEVLEFFNGTFVYWTTQYPEHRGQTFKLIG